MLPRAAVLAADTAAAAVSTAAGLPSAAVGLASTEVWPRADLVQLGLLPCPAEQASAESLVEASTIVTTSGASPFLG
jgi:hypothetical protein